MAYSARAVANSLIELARQKNILDVSPMKLQKLIFYAQSWYLRLYNTELFNDPIERWQYGPVVRSVYDEFKSYGALPIASLASDAQGFIPTIKPNESTTKDFLNKILDVYGQKTAEQLSNMTHQPGTSWSLGAPNTIITLDELKQGVL